MTETKNIGEGSNSQDFNGQGTDYVAHTVNILQKNLVCLISFFRGAGSNTSLGLKKFFTKKTTRTVTNEDLLFFPQAPDKFKYQAEISALLVCYN